MAWIWILVLFTLLAGICSCEHYYPRTPHHPELNPAYPIDIYDLGQISGLAILDSSPLIFHRGTTIWTSDSFNASHRLVDRVPIEVDPLVLLDNSKGTLIKSWGSGLFYMPHGVEVDTDGNVWVTDVGLHQVMKFPPNSTTPSLVLGSRFEPGSSNTQFCQPSDIAVSKSGFIFVSVGYCNSRVMKFDAEGKFVAKFEDKLAIPHSLTLLEDRDLLCVADRENERVICIAAGLHGSQFGSVRHVIGGVGRVYAITASPSTGSSDVLFAVGGHGNGMTLDLESGQVVDVWGSQFLSPHDLALGGGYLYVGETGPNRLTQFFV